MIYLIAPGDQKEAVTIISSAIERSCGLGQIKHVTLNEWINLQESSDGLLSIAICPLENWSKDLIRALQNPSNKTLMLGSIPDAIAQYLGGVTGPVSAEQKEACGCEPAPTYNQSNSKLWIKYKEVPELGKPVIKKRACLRYDFTDEWNNLGYGAVRADGSIWALSQSVRLPLENVLATIGIEDEEVGAYAGFWFNEHLVAGTALWFNRAVGPVDSQEWRLVERYISGTGFPQIVCQPVLSEIPYGYHAAVTMRLDCDEDVESARALWQAYLKMGVPFSLALHARVLEDQRHHLLPKEVLANGGALLSHTATHAPDWGGSYSAAYEEGRASAEIIEQSVGCRVRYAVSPFHQSPEYARSALADVGYDGCIGGIIRNDYDFLMGRSGVPPEGARGFIGHSQQCMLHGDCMLEGEDPLAVFKQAFELSKESKTFFGYLDHPFSERYQYGWKTEEQRINAHEQLVEHIRKQEKVLFLNENDAMDFMFDRSSICVSNVDGGISIKSALIAKSTYKQSIEYGNKTYALGEAEVLL